MWFPAHLDCWSWTSGRRAAESPSLSRHGPLVLHGRQQHNFPWGTTLHDSGYWSNPSLGLWFRGMRSSKWLGGRIIFQVKEITVVSLVEVLSPRGLRPSMWQSSKLVVCGRGPTPPLLLDSGTQVCQLWQKQNHIMVSYSKRRWNAVK